MASGGWAGRVDLEYECGKSGRFGYPDSLCLGLGLIIYLVVL